MRLMPASAICSVLGPVSIIPSVEHIGRGPDARRQSIRAVARGSCLPAGAMLGTLVLNVVKQRDNHPVCGVYAAFGFELVRKERSYYF